MLLPTQLLKLKNYTNSKYFEFWFLKFHSTTKIKLLWKLSHLKYTIGWSHTLLVSQERWSFRFLGEANYWSQQHTLNEPCGNLYSQFETTITHFNYKLGSASILTVSLSYLISQSRLPALTSRMASFLSAVSLDISDFNSDSFT